MPSLPCSQLGEGFKGSNCGTGDVAWWHWHGLGCLLPKRCEETGPYFCCHLKINSQRLQQGCVLVPALEHRPFFSSCGSEKDQSLCQNQNRHNHLPWQQGGSKPGTCKGQQLPPRTPGCLPKADLSCRGCTGLQGPGEGSSSSAWSCFQAGTARTRLLSVLWQRQRNARGMWAEVPALFGLVLLPGDGAKLGLTLTCSFLFAQGRGVASLQRFYSSETGQGAADRER